MGLINGIHMGGENIMVEDNLASQPIHPTPPDPEQVGMFLLNQRSTP